MTLVFWLLILICFAVALVSLIKPIIPGVLFVWIGFLIYQFGIHQSHLSWVFWSAMVVLTLFIFVSDLLMNRYFVNRLEEAKKESGLL